MNGVRLLYFFAGGEFTRTNVMPAEVSTMVPARGEEMGIR